MKKTINKVYKISSTLDQVWKALVDPETIDAWGGGPSKMNSEAGSDFELWDGDIYGKNIEIVEKSKLVQEWFSGDWPTPSIVTFILKDDENGTILELKQINFPIDEFDDIEHGWDEYYLGPLKELLEKGS